MEQHLLFKKMEVVFFYCFLNARNKFGLGKPMVAVLWKLCQNRNLAVNDKSNARRRNDENDESNELNQFS